MWVYSETVILPYDIWLMLIVKTAKKNSMLSPLGLKMGMVNFARGHVGIKTD